MSEENVEAMGRALEAFVDADAEGFVRFMDPEIQFEPHIALVEGRYEGHDGIRKFMADAAENAEELGIVHSHVRDLGDRVLALGAFRIGWSRSGIEAEAPFAILASFRDGLIIHLKDYGEKAPALEAAGLSE